MSMDHKAFVFDYDHFAEQLEPLLNQALATGDITALVHFIENNPSEFTDPFEGEPLNSSWQGLVDPKDAQQYGDFALTKFYNRSQDIGLGHDWLAISEILDKHLNDGPSTILGSTLSSDGKVFDPGLMGSYFQSPTQVRASLVKLVDLAQREPHLAATLKEVIEMLDEAGPCPKVGVIRKDIGDVRPSNPVVRYTRSLHCVNRMPLGLPGLFGQSR